MQASMFPAACVVSVCCTQALAQTTTRASVNSRGEPAGIAAMSFLGGLSSDGRFVTFTSDAPNLAPGDVHGSYDAFLHDRTSGATVRVGLSSAGAAPNGSTSAGAVSTDGRFIAFFSLASNLVNGDQNGVRDVFLRDELLGITTRVSVATGGAEGNAESLGRALTPDGAFVGFQSAASNLDPAKTSTNFAPFVHEVASGTTSALRLVPVGPEPDANVNLLAMTGDARFFALDSYSTNVVPGDANGGSDAFVHDRLLGTTVLVSVTSAGIQGNGSSFGGGLSADGRYAVFSSWSTNLVPGDTNASLDVFLRDLQLGTTTRVSVSASGVQGDHHSAAPTMTPDGRFVAFSSWATNFAPGDGNNSYDQFLLDRQTGALHVASVGTLGQFVYGNNLPTVSRLSDDGNVLSFSGGWAGIVPTQIYSNDTVYVHDRTVLAPVATYCTTKVNSLGCRPEISSAGVPRQSVTDNFFLVANNVRVSKPGIFLWGNAPSATPFGGGILCVSAPVNRTPIQDSGVSSPVPCGGAYSFHFRWYTMLSHGLAPGDTVYGQYLSRDPGFAPPDNVGLTDAVWFTIVP